MSIHPFPPDLCDIEKTPVADAGVRCCFQPVFLLQIKRLVFHATCRDFVGRLGVVADNGVCEATVEATFVPYFIDSRVTECAMLF